MVVYNEPSSSHLGLHHGHQLLIGLGVLLSDCLELGLHGFFAEATHSSHSVVVFFAAIASHSTEKSVLVASENSLELAHKRHDGFFVANDLSVQGSLVVF